MVARQTSKSSSRKQPGKSLDRQAWIEAALKTLSSAGVAGVRIEMLARSLRITKGSFYYHFRNRDELFTAMLHYWRQHLVIDVIGDLERIADPRLRFRRLIRVPFSDSRADLDLEFAVGLWARSDRRVRAVLRDVDALRLDFLQKAIAACGVPLSKARSRAMLTLTFLRAAPRVSDEVLAQCETLLISP